MLAQDDHYGAPGRLPMDYAEIVNAELHEMQAAGIAATDRDLEGITVPTVVHLRFGYAAALKEDKPTGYSFLPALERCRATAVPTEAAQPRLALAPDCGMKYPARDVAFGKLVEMVEGARDVRGT